MSYYVRGPDGKRVLKVSSKDQKKIPALLEATEARAKIPGKQGSGVADRRKFNGRRKPKQQGPKQQGRTRYKKKPKPPPEAPKYDLLTLSADKLTDELRKQFLECILKGLPQESAAWICGIHPQTLRIWQAKAMDPLETDPKYGAFVMAVQAAESLLESRIMAHAITVGGKYGQKGELSFTSQGDARAALQLRFKTRYGGGNAVTVDKETGALTVGAAPKPTISETAEMTLEELQGIRDAAIRALDRSIVAGGLRAESEGLKEPRIGRKVQKL